MVSATPPSHAERPLGVAAGLSGESVPWVDRVGPRASVVSPAARKAIRQRMLFFRQASLDRVAALAELPPTGLQAFRRELREGDLPDTLFQRGAGVAFTHELPQGALLYLLVRATRPARIVETGVGPGYSTAWLLAALDANGAGELVSLGPGTTAGRPAGVQNLSIGQFVPPRYRSRWTLALGNSEDRLRQILSGGERVDLFFYDNGPDATRARFELRTAWDALSPRGILLAHHVEANTAWAEFCRRQGLPLQILDPGPPPMGAIGVRAGRTDGASA
ncbi:MAG TPA: class I SAM-dependent methyltransferase [Thermoplasmata archaeon]|nr:class I SAM-dependent methyltransferase [Thermoplasmata archaeon]